jgi:peptidoglycan/LPS O-acetylase OafA/YrhL
VETTRHSRARPFPRWTWWIVVVLLISSAVSVAAFVDACNTDARAHDRAIFVAAISFGCSVFIALWGRVGRRAWLAPSIAVALGVAAVLVFERLQFGACLN